MNLRMGRNAPVKQILSEEKPSECSRKGWQSTAGGRRVMLWRHLAKAVVATLLLGVALGAKTDDKWTHIIARGGHQWGTEQLWKVIRGFAEPQNIPRNAFDVQRWADDQNVERFVEGKCDLLLHRHLPVDREADILKQHFPDGAAQPRIYSIAHAKVAAIVHPSNLAKVVSLDQIKQLLRMEGFGLRWNQFGGTSNAVIRCYGEKRDAPSRLVIRHACMMLGPEYPTGYHLYREDFAQLANSTEVIKKVQQDINGINSHPLGPAAPPP